MKHARTMGTFVTFAAVGVAALSAGGAMAAEPLEEIVVTAARMGRAAVTTETVGRSSSTGAPLERLSLTWSVAYTDLDLSQPSGVAVLDKRIQARASAVCKELDRLFPLSPRGGPACVKEAAQGAKAQAKGVIAAQQKHAASAD